MREQTAKYKAHELNLNWLKHEEETELFRRMRAGDAAAHTRLVAGYILFANKVARGAAGKNLSDADLMSAAHEGLLKAMTKFKPKLGFRFSTFCVKYVQGMVHRFARDYTRQHKIAHRVFERAPETGVVPTPDEILERKETVARVRAVVASLPKEERKVLNLWMAGHRFRVIGEKMGFSRQRAQQVYENAMKKLRARGLREELA